MLATPEIKSTLKAPTTRSLEASAALIDPADQVALYLREGWSLAICCKDCRRSLIEWTPPELQERFAGTASDEDQGSSLAPYVRRRRRMRLARLCGVPALLPGALDPGSQARLAAITRRGVGRDRRER